MNILVLGATGTVGRSVMAGLAARGVKAVGAARRPLPGGVAIDLAQPEGIEAAARGCDAAFLVTPVGRDEAAQGLAAVDALRRAGVARIVYSGVMHADAMAAIPHVAAKLPVRAAVLQAGGTVIEPCFFFQNDLFVGDAIRLGGVYPIPVGRRGLSAVDAADIGRAAANALISGDWAGRAVPVCGDEALAGPDFAANWAVALGRPVDYGGDAVEPFVAALAKVYPGFDDWMAEDFRAMMRVTQQIGCIASEDEAILSGAIIGQPPVRHRAWIEAQLHSEGTPQ